MEKCRERPVEVKTEISIAGTNKDRRFWARQPKTPNIGEESPCRACAIEGKTATGIEEPVVMDMSGAGRRDPSARNPKRMVVGPESPRESRRGEGGGEATRSGSRNESEKGEIDPERLSSRVPEIMTLGPENP